MTSCDLLTTIFYIANRKDKKLGKVTVELVLSICELLAFDRLEALKIIQGMDEALDFEDLLQVELAKKSGCDAILTNDIHFLAPDMPKLTAKALIEAIGSQHA